MSKKNDKSGMTAAYVMKGSVTAAVVILCLGCAMPATEQASEISVAARAPQGKVMSLENYEVTMSAPVLVARSKGYLWFPTLVHLADGGLQVIMSPHPDAATKNMTSLNTFSRDGGRSWSEPVVAAYSEDSVRLISGDQLFLPYYLSPKGDGLAAPYTVVARGTHEIKTMPGKLTVTGWPRPLGSPDTKTGVGMFSFNGQTVALPSGGYLATLYGYFKDTKRYSLVAAESADGVNWKIRSVIADENCKLPGSEGPCEAALCRLADGRLMCIFRMAGQDMPFGQSWSEDEGKTWSEPIAMKDAHAVQPSLAVMKDGAVVLSGGRAGLFLWVNADGKGKDWERVDLQANHNKYSPGDPITATTTFSSNSSCYTEVVALDDTHLLVVYDRLGNGWNPISPDSQETNSVWVVPVELKKK